MKSSTQDSAEKSIYSNGFVSFSQVIDKVLDVRDMLWSIGYSINILLWIFYDNKGIVLVAYRANMLIKKRRIDLAFH